MARTAEGDSLTRRHRQLQLQLRARAMRDFVAIWPLWQGDEQSFERLVQATLPLVRAHRQLSGAVAAAYFGAFRRAERAGGTAKAIPVATVDEKRVVASLYVTGRVMTQKAILAGQSPQAAMQTALTRTSGAMSRHVLDGGRQVITASSDEDREALGWARVVGSGCAFCLMLASRGPVYSEESVGFDAHDHCSCSAEPAYEGSEWPGRGREYARLWDEAQREGRESGEFQRLKEAGSPNPGLAVFRNHLAAKSS